MNSLRKLQIVALLVMILLTGAARAEIIYSGSLNTAIPDNGIGLYVNIIDGSTFTGPGTFPTNPGPGANYDFNIFGGTTSWTFFPPGTAGQSPPTVPASSRGYVSSATNGPVLALAPGTLISNLSIFNTGTASGNDVATGAAIYFGFRFRNEGTDLGSAADDTVHFAWGLIMLPDPTATQNGVLMGYAYESVPGVGIAAGAIPEPGTAALLGMAGVAAAVVAFRRRLGSSAT